MNLREEMESILNGILGADFSQRSERASCILETLKHVDDEEQPSWLAYVLSNFGLIEDHDEVMKGKRLDDKRYEEIIKKVGDDASRAFHLWMRNNPEVEELAAKLNKFLHGLKDDDERSVALAVILSDRHIPYCRIPEELSNSENLIEEMGNLMRGGNATEEMKRASVTIQNILRRRNLTPATIVLLWDTMSQQETDLDKFFVFYSAIVGVEEETKSTIMKNFGGGFGIMGLRL